MTDDTQKQRILHGNNAKINPKKHVESLYQSNRVTLSDQKLREAPLVRDEDVEYARKFQEENEK